MPRFLIPLAVFIVMVGFLYVGLSLKPREIPSPLIDQAAPAFEVPRLHEPEQTIATKDMLGKVWLLNVWASWCVSCRQEHPLFVELSRTKEVPIIGLNYKDKREDGIRWLRQLGNPYVTSAYDIDGRVGINFGVYGVPETFMIDKQGIIRYKHIGPVNRAVIQNEILPLFRELNG